MKHCAREVLFREAVLNALGVRGQEEDKTKYCLTCKKLRRADCAKCEYKGNSNQ